MPRFFRSQCSRVSFSCPPQTKRGPAVKVDFLLPTRPSDKSATRKLRVYVMCDSYYGAVATADLEVRRGFNCILRHFRRREASAHCTVAFSPALATLPSQLTMKPRAGPTPDVSDAYRDLEDENVEGADGEEEPEAASPTAPPKLLEGVESDSDDEGGSAKGAKMH